MKMKVLTILEIIFAIGYIVTYTIETIREHKMK